MYEEIVTWYTQNKRDLLFRKYSDPYAVWVSEIMAQQTKIETMLPYFERWMKQFPTIASCASASENNVLKMWEGLGYYRRAKLLHKGCAHILNNHSGIFPVEYDDILNIPGIGDYTAAAIYSIVFNGKKAAIDGNVIRIVSRVFEIKNDSTSVKTKKEILTTVDSWMSECKVCNYSDFTQGLMEIGALICTPKSPKCSICPLKEKCSAFLHDTQLDYPKRPQKKVSPVFEYDVLIINKNNKLLVSEDWSDGLMIGLTRLPQVTRENLHQFNIINNLGELTHVFSHKKWKLTIYIASLKEGFSIPKSWHWLDSTEAEATPFITAHKKILASYNNESI
jgi:A/G-specific adenine glycosylase